MSKKNLIAFTLIEAIIAISVFCIGILAVFYGVSQTLRNQEYADVQISSAFFAREGIEMMFNLRDANYHKELPWNCIFHRVDNLQDVYNEDINPYCDDYLGSGTANVLKIGIGSGSEYIYVQTGSLSDDFEDNFDNYQVYFHTGNVIDNQTGFIYNHNGTEEEKTGFARYLVITGIVENGDYIDRDKILKVESHVLYKKGALTGERVMETFIGNYEF